MYRSPPEVEGKRNKCPVCVQSYTETDMVECTKCKKWIHYTCAGVDDSVANDHTWRCTKCTERLRSQTVAKTVLPPTQPTLVDLTPCTSAQAPPNKANSIASVSSKGSRGSVIRAKQKLKLLEEQQKIIEEKEKMLKERLTLLDEIDDEDIESMFSKVDLNNSTNSKRHPPSTRVNPQSVPQIQGSFPALSHHTLHTQNVKRIPPQTTIPYERAPFENTFEEPRITRSMPQFEAASIAAAAPLTTQQSAARHVISKELPVFSGDPEQWPIFISAYHQTTIACGLTDTENLYRLQKCLKGKARAMVEAQLTLATCVPDIIETLRQFFGRPELILGRQIDRIRKLPPPRQDRLDSVVQYAIAVKNLSSTLQQADMNNHLSNPMLVTEIVDKLPSTLRMSWATHKRTVQEPNNLETLSDWLYDIASDASTVMSGNEWMNITDTQTAPKKKNEQVNVHTETPTEPSKRERSCLVCKEECITVSECQKFENLPLKVKWENVKNLRLCKQCLKRHSNRCTQNTSCNVNGCERKHHPLLHNPNNDHVKQSPQINNEVNLSHKTLTLQVRFRVIPVILSNGPIHVKTFAFLDEGSSTSLISNDIATQLRLKGTQEPFCLKWSDETSRLETDSCIVNINICGTYINAPTYTISHVRTVRSLNLPIQSLEYTTLAEHYPHLRTLPIESYKNAHPGILIGLRNWKLALPLRVREGADNDPIAAKCRLGWTVFATIENASSSTEFHLHMCECQSNGEAEIKEMMKNFFSTDSLGLTSSDRHETENATNEMSKITKHDGNRYVAGLLWKYKNVKLPDSRPMAMKRLKCLENRLKLNPKLAENVKKQIQEYVQKDYIRKLSPSELAQPQEKIWYLPIFPVINPNKPEKIRLVWDAAAEVNGTSLNSFLSKGVDLNPSLFGVLIRSRERKVCITGDIKEMFHQIIMSESDQQVLRFLWRDCEDRKPDTYVMRVMTFGASCSPFTAQFVKNQNAMNFVTEHPAAVNCIIKDHYVDDLLTSVDTEDQAIELAMTVRNIHRTAGFEIRNWKSNSQQVMKALNPESTQPTVNMNMNRESSTEKVLGMWWCLESDEYLFSLRYNKGGKNVLNGSTRPTKREVLKTLMSIYDPLGLIANFLVYLKILLQEIWRTGLQWDETISDNHFEDWLVWLKHLPEVEQLRIKRCYLHQFSTWENLECQLHVFVDASDKACAVVAYLRVSREDEVETALIGSKTKVAPIKLRTIPRLELDAAVMGSRFAKQILEHLTIKIQQTIFWCDSKTVLCWLQNDPRIYNKYVGFRITEIQENFDASHWHYIPSKLNVADEATKFVKFFTTSEDCRWFKGPNFLHQPPELWPTINIKNKQTTEELSFMHITNESVHVPVVEIAYNRYSSWKKLICTMAYVIRFVNNICATINKNIAKQGILSQEEYKKAELNLLRLTQSEVYDNEIMLLLHSKSNSHKIVNKSSPIYKYSPYLDEDKILRIQGRIDAAPDAAHDTKRPIILPNSHHITRLVVQDIHEKFHHQNHETVINELKQKYFVPKLRGLYKKVRRNCQHCKIKNARPQAPQMAQLPSARLATNCFPFTFVGVDYFGPINVTVRRRPEKRWGVLFTCMTIRAIHLEVAHSLTTDSFILCFHNFISRRGMPREIFCDRGTNFIGAERVLREELRNINPTLIAKQFVNPELSWHFNPPLSPHMGGAWERLIRTVKNTLYSSLPSSLNDQLLQSCLIAVEDIVNSRPLTYIPVDERKEAITPNHFLKQSSGGLKPMAQLNDSAKCLRASYLYKEQFANKCWKRFITEYLPELTLRSKWYDQIRPLKVGDIVIVVDKDLPRNNYPKGRIIDVNTSKDGQVRSAKVQTTDGIYERPVMKLALLNLEDSTTTSLGEACGTGGDC